MVCSWSATSTLSACGENVIGVLACSALKRRYRDILSGRSSVKGTQSPSFEHCVFVLLKASENELRKRIASRQGHFMPPSLINSQLEILELPDGKDELAIVIETDGIGVDQVVMKVSENLRHMISHIQQC